MFGTIESPGAVDAEKNFTVQNDHGIHGRPLSTLVKCAKEHECQIFFWDKDSIWLNMSIFNFWMSGQARKGSKVKLGLIGKKHEACMRKIGELFETEFGELDKDHVAQGNCGHQ